MGKLGVDVHLHLAERPPDAGGFPSIGARGCFESHLACLRAARDAEVEVAVMAEDDVVVGAAFARHVPAIERWLRDQDWSVLYLGYLEEQSPT